MKRGINKVSSRNILKGRKLIPRESTLRRKRCSCRLIRESRICIWHKASRIAKIHLDSEIYLVSNLAEEIKKNLFIKNFNSLEDAFSTAIRVQGEKARVLVMPYGNSTLPVFKE